MKDAIASSDAHFKEHGPTEIPYTPEQTAARQAEINAELAKLTKYEAEEKYKDLRQAALIPLDGEGMDAMRKALTQIYSALDYLAPPVELEEYFGKVEAIKTKHPKPQK
jgi:hypothetical protein